MKTKIELADELYMLVKIFTSCKDGWETVEERAEIYRKMFLKMKEYELLIRIPDNL